MPSSFSRFLSDEELEDVRRLYLESLEGEGAGAVPEPGPATAGVPVASPTADEPAPGR